MSKAGYQTSALLILFSVALLCCLPFDSKGQSREDSPKVYPQLGHTDSVKTVAITPDGKRIISGSADKTVKVWELESGRLIHTLAGHTDSIISIAITSDGKRVVSGGNDKTVRVWDIESGRLIHTFQGHNGYDYFQPIAVTPDGTRVLTVDTVMGADSLDASVKVWDINSGRLLQTLRGLTSRIRAITVTPDSKRVIARYFDKAIAVWDIESGRLIQTLEVGIGGSITVTPDGKWLIADSDQSQLKVWDIESGQLIHTLQSQNISIEKVASTPDSKRVLSLLSNYSYGYHSFIEMWDIESGRLIRVFQGDAFSDLAMTPDGKRVISNEFSKLKVWDIDSGKLIRTLQGHVNQINSIAVTPDGARVISGSEDHTVKVWDINGGKLLQTLQYSISATASAIASNGKRLVLGRWNSLTIWDIENGGLLRNLTLNDASIYLVAVPPNSKRVITTDYDRTLRVWDIDSGKLIYTLAGHTNIIKSIAVTSDSKRVISGSDDGTLKLWDIETGKLIRTFESGTPWFWVRAIAVTSDGARVVAGSEDRTLKVWDIETGKLIQTLQGHTATVLAVAFTPDGKRVVSGSYDETVRVWDIASGKLIHTLEGHTGIVNSIAVTSDGKHAISGSHDGTLKLWEIESGKLIHTLPDQTSSVLIVDEKHVVSVKEDGTIQIWNAQSTEELVQLISFEDGEWLSITPEGYYKASTNGDKHLNVRIGSRVYGIDQFRSTFYKPQVVEAALRLNDSSAAVASTVGSNAPTIRQAANFEPPSVVIKAPDDGQQINGLQIQLSAFIEDRNNPLKSVQIFVNQNRTATTRARGWGAEYEESIINLAEGQKSLELKRAIQLQPGDNIIKLVAANAYAETPRIIHVTAVADNMAGTSDTESRPGGLPQLWILSIGVNYAPQLAGHLQKLDFAATDSEAFVRKFKEQEGRLFSKVNALVINDDLSKDIENLAQNKDAAKQEIKKISAPTFEHIADNLKYLRRARKGDFVMLFIAGHAVSDNGAYYFMPSDAALDDDGGVKRSKAVSWTDIRDAIYLVDVKVWVFLDTCHAGNAVGRVKTADANFLIKELQDSAIVFASSTDEQDSQEAATWGHGAFTYALLKGLDGQADNPRDGTIMMSELKRYVIDLVTKETNEKQTPVLYPKDFQDLPIFRLGK